jgi:hypothetical protein
MTDSRIALPPKAANWLHVMPPVASSSLGFGPAARAMDARLDNMRTLMTAAVSNIANVRDTNAEGLSRADQLRAKLPSIKRVAAAVGMYLDPDWRRRLFARLDQLCDPDDWNFDEMELPSEQSFSTFLRMIIYLHPTRRPGLGISPKGHFLASWTHESGDRIVIECIGHDQVRWVISRTIDGEPEYGAGTGPLHRVPDVTAGYEPDALFTDGHKLLT